MRTREALDLDEARAAILEGRAVLIPDIDVSICEIDGRPFCFASDRHIDPIQRHNRKGLFYESEELALIKAHLPKDAVFVDIGSNVGNHSMFVAGFLAPKRIIPFEPNPLAYKLLLANVAMNGFHDVFDLSHVGLGLSDKLEGGFAMTPRNRNLGAARMQAGEGDIQTITGDAALQNDAPDFLKIDVEGMEMRALAGLEETVRTHKPMILIEVDQENYTDFDQWVVDHDYDVLEEIQRYRVNKNFLLRHKSVA